VTDTAWIDAALTSARPQAVGALLRYFRNLDTAEEAFQNACLRALKGSTVRIIATTSCGCCSSAAIPICRRRSRSRWRCASSPA